MVVLGRIVAPYGVQGWVKVFPMGDDPQQWHHMPSWWLGVDADGGEWQRIDVESMRLHGKGLVAKFAGVDDRASAEALDGRFIAAPREALPPVGKDEFYWADLIGARVVNLQEQDLGTVVELLESGANAVLVVRESTLGDTGPKVKQRLLPFVGSVVQAVDVAGGVIRVDWAADW